MGEAFLAWLKTYESVAIWLEGIALVLIFVWDRLDSRQQHRETLAQMEIMQRQADSMRESVAVARDGAEAAKANAQAAILNAQAVINSERPWIVVSVRPHESTVGSFVFTVTNKGRTPAEFLSGSFNSCFDSYPDELPT